MYVPTALDRMTFVITPEIQTKLNELKKQMFYDNSRSEMVRTIIKVGIDVLQNKPTSLGDE